MIPTKRNLYFMLLQDIFYEVSWDEIDANPDRAHYHCMDYQAVETLGQFLDRFPVDNEKLKHILVLGLLESWRIGSI